MDGRRSKILLPLVCYSLRRMTEGGRVGSRCEDTPVNFVQMECDGLKACYDFATQRMASNLTLNSTVSASAASCLKLASWPAEDLKICYK